MPPDPEAPPDRPADPGHIDIMGASPSKLLFRPAPLAPLPPDVAALHPRFCHPWPVAMTLRGSFSQCLDLAVCEDSGSEHTLSFRVNRRAVGNVRDHLVLDADANPLFRVRSTAHRHDVRLLPSSNASSGRIRIRSKWWHRHETCLSVRIPSANSITKLSLHASKHETSAVVTLDHRHAWLHRHSRRPRVVARLSRSSSSSWDASRSIHADSIHDTVAMAMEATAGLDTTLVVLLAVLLLDTQHDHATARDISSSREWRLSREDASLKQHKADANRNQHWNSATTPTATPVKRLTTRFL